MSALKVPLVHHLDVVQYDLFGDPARHHNGTIILFILTVLDDVCEECSAGDDLSGAWNLLFVDHKSEWFLLCHG